MAGGAGLIGALLGFMVNPKPVLRGIAGAMLILALYGARGMLSFPGYPLRYKVYAVVVIGLYVALLFALVPRQVRWRRAALYFGLLAALSFLFSAVHYIRPLWRMATSNEPVRSFLSAIPGLLIFTAPAILCPTCAAVLAWSMRNSGFTIGPDGEIVEDVFEFETGDAE